MSAWETPLLILILLGALLAFRRQGGLGVGPMWIAGAGLSALAMGFVASAYAPKAQKDATARPGAEALPAHREGDARTTSKACRACHPGEYASWHRTWHRTMTQEATPETVLGAFKGQLLEDRGERWRVFEEGGVFYAEQLQPPPPRGEPARRPIVMTTGAHHLQNYWFPGYTGGLIQLPFAWWVKDQRWIPTADSFLQPPPDQAPKPLWNGNCNPCHTVGSISAVDHTLVTAETEVAELGISCEACHGPGEAHVAANRSPLRRYLYHLGLGNDEADPTVANAARMPREASAAACGRCHGLFMTRDASEVNREGDPFVAGDTVEHTRDYIRVGPDPAHPGEKMLRPLPHKSPTLTAEIGGRPIEVRLLGTTRFGVHLAPVTPSEGALEGQGRLRLSRGRQLLGDFSAYPWGALMAPRSWPPSGLGWLLAMMGYDQNTPTAMDMSAFWADGTVRTTGREMNGMHDTPCYTRGEMTCLSCHSMHQGDPNDLMKPGMPTDGVEANAACAECHPSQSGDVEAHTHHPPGSSGSVCYNCHMPRTSYGLMGAIRAHRVDAPDITSTQATGRPDACSLCHLDRPLAWSGKWLAEWYGAPEPVYTEADRTLSAIARWMVQGDAAQRAITAWHTGWGPALAASEADAWSPPLLADLLTDDYAVVRYIAWSALKNQPTFADLKYDYVAPPEARAEVAREVLERWRGINRDGVSGLTIEPRSVLLDAPGVRDAGRISSLKQGRDNQPVYIAE